MWLCAACVRDAAGLSDRGRAGGAGRSPAGAAAGCGAANLCKISPPRDIVSAGRGSFSKDVLCRMTDIHARAQAHEASGIVRGHHE